MKRFVSGILTVVLMLTLTANVFALKQYGALPIYVGDAAVDYMADEILKEIPTAGKSKTEQIRAVYNWIIQHCTREESKWNGKYYFNESAVAANSGAYADRINARILTGDAIVRQDLSEIAGVYSSYDSNYYITAFAYEMMMKRNGNCAHYSALLSVLLSHLGFDCRLIDGDFINGDGSKVMHKWNYVLMDGKFYWLDVRMDHANYSRTGKINYQYFMITNLSQWERSHSWNHAYSNGLAANAAKVAALYNTTASKYANSKVITVRASRSGSASGGGRYFQGDQATLSADSSRKFAGWYNEWGNLVSTDRTYRFKVTQNALYYALYDGDIFADIPADAWYLDIALEAYDRGLVKGTTAVTFQGDGKFTRAMVATILARVAGEEITGFPKAPFKDVAADTWYTDAVNWAYAKGIVMGRTATEFAPNAQITRQEFVTMVVRYLEGEGFKTDPAPLNYADKGDILPYAKEAMGVAQAMGLIGGYPDNTIRPKGVLTRAEGATIVLRLADRIDAA